MASRQLNIRLDAVAMDELEAHAFLRRLPAAALARDIVLKFLRETRDAPGLESAMMARADHDGKSTKRENVTRLRPQLATAHRCDPSAIAQAIMSCVLGPDLTRLGSREGC